MNHGLYNAFLGMRARQRTLEIQANNIANASTTGFKAERLFYSAFESIQKGASAGKQNLIAGVAASGASDFSFGAIRQTGRNLDIAIEGDAFLQVQTPRGVRYTRAGSLNRDANGQLVTKAGDLVVGERGPVAIPNGEITIGTDGTIAVGGQSFDKLRLARFDNPAQALQKEGDTYYSPTGQEQPKDAAASRIIHGALESSNINAVSEMVAMINNNREFDSLQKSMSLIMNDLGRKIAGEIGKI